MSELEPNLRNISDIFKLNTDKRIDISNLSANERAIYEVLQDETYKAIRLLENLILSK